MSQKDRSKELEEAQKLLKEDETNYLRAEARAITRDLLDSFVKSGLATQEQVDQMIKNYEKDHDLN